MSEFDALIAAVKTVPAGRWAIGVSGGADSTALLRLLHKYRSDLGLHVVHLDHQTRGDESTEDASFVTKLARELGLPATVVRRSELEETRPDLPANPSARYRAIRLSLFAEVVRRDACGGVLLAHHADDVAETVFQRLLRGSGSAGLTGISPVSRVGDLAILRPLLRVRRSRLRDYLETGSLHWREDASNRSNAYLRNRTRSLLFEKPGLTEALLTLADANRNLHNWVRAMGSTFPEAVTAHAFDGPLILANDAARRWLVAQGVPNEQMTPAVIERLLEMARDAATPAKQQFPGNVTIRRRKGVLSGGV